MSVAQVRTVWSGGPSAPGLTIFNIDNSSGTGDFDAAVAAVVGFWEGLKTNIPDEYTLRVDQLALSYAEADGVLTGSQNASSAPAAIAGTSVAGFAHGTGIRCDWKTLAINNGRRVSGRTYLVPWTHQAFTSSGSINPTDKAAITGVCNSLIDNLATAGMPLVVWSRPTTANPVGVITPVTDAQIPDKAAVLRGRRD